MKAVRVHDFGGPEVLRLEEIEDLTPRSEEIVIDVKAAGVNPVDVYIRTGTHSVKPPLPYTPGVDGAGVISSIGKKVKDYRVGERVYISGTLSGTYAERTLCRPEHIFPLPEFLTFGQGAAIGIPYATAYYGLFSKAKAVAAESVLIHGASGGVGMAAVQLAHMAGLKVFATAGTSSGLELLQQQSAQHVFDHTLPDYREKILKANGGHGVDLILEMLANENLADDLQLLASKGRVIVIGSRGPVMIDPRDLMVREATVSGILILNLNREERRKIDQTVCEALHLKKINPVIGKIFPLSQAAEAHEAILTRGAAGKIILVP